MRIFNTYGPWMHAADGRVVSNFIVQALQGQNITIFGDGSQTRSFCYVDDLIEGFLRFMEAGPDVHGPINLGNPNEFTIRELAEAVIKRTIAYFAERLGIEPRRTKTAGRSESTRPDSRSEMEAS